MKTMKELLEQCLIEDESKMSVINGNIKKRLKVNYTKLTNKEQLHVDVLEDIEKEVNKIKGDSMTWKELKKIISKSKKFKEHGLDINTFKNLMYNY